MLIFTVKWINLIYRQPILPTYMKLAIVVEVFKSPNTEQRNCSIPIRENLVVIPVKDLCLKIS